MGILFDVVMQQKRNFLIERLTEKQITKSQLGKDIHDCDYEELKYELVLASFRDINIESDANKYF
ncbi:hypothetical protein SFC50_25950 [Bacillus infantis]|jgi:hypothetical protein|uniref:hypothetical protein n=1 Tax=Bacillus infantis TaxID=324767 RepID=UPI003982201C